MGIDQTCPRLPFACFDVRTALREAIDRGELYVEYQPKVGLRADAPHSAEALVRWNHAEFGAIPPSDFIPLAEACGMIGDIGQLVLDQCFELLVRARALGLSLPRLAINISAIELLAGGLAARIGEIARAHRVEPSCLEIEITETAVISDPGSATRELESIRALGASVAIDDFGTGYSSLAYLKHLPADVLKLDRAFVAEIDTSPVDRRIVRTVVALGHTLGLSVVAEGVERETQAALLRSCRVDAAQGYYYAKAMSGPAWLGWMANAGSGFRPASVAQYS